MYGTCYKREGVTSVDFLDYDIDDTVGHVKSTKTVKAMYQKVDGL